MNTARVTKTAKAEVKTADKENVKVTAAKAEPVKTEAPVKAEPVKAAKAEPAKTTKAAAKAEPAKTTKTAAKAEPAKTTKAAAKAESAKTTKVAKTTAKAATKTAAKKTTAKKTATTKRAAKATEEVFIQYGGGEVSTSDIVARVVEATGKKASSIKALNVYVQPETGKIYYTADGMSGEIAY
ncbi:MAG: DUF6465 family protein [Bacteroides sp.]|nr:DUF6465 family protein [Bacteroides sp.]MCM1550795.1 DUF6465 family protein [Clostridium sp.]